MLDFHSPVMEDKLWVDHALSFSNHMGCIYTFAQMYIWSEKYKTRICRHNDCVLIMGGEPGYYMYPAGKYDITEVIGLLTQDAAERGIKLRIAGAEKWQLDELCAAFPGRFDAEPSRDDFDYIYNAQDLIELSGRKYHGKRNHISKFTRAFPDWQYEHIDDSNTEECINASLEWCKQNGCSENSPYRHELCAIHKALRERKSLGIIGGLIRIDGKVVALTLGERLNKDTFVTHFEKALGGFEEAYTLINREFAARSLGEYRYINREEDLGIEGLRKAKLSYKPAILLEKFNVTER